MNSWKKLRSVLMMALFAMLAGTSFAAATAPSALFAGDTPSQAQDPVDCKKKPSDPRCKGKPYSAPAIRGGTA